MEQEKFPNAPEYNHEKVEKFRKVYGEILHKLIARSGDDFTEIENLQTDLVQKVRDLESKYPNAVRYGMFHIMGGSTIPENLPALYDDFPGDDSVEKFLNDLAKKYE